MKDKFGRDTELFGKLDCLLPDDFKDPVMPSGSMLPNEIDVSGLPEGEWTARGVYRMELSVPYGRRYGRGVLADPSPSGELLSFWGGKRRSVYLTLRPPVFGSRGAYAFLVGSASTDGLSGGPAFIAHRHGRRTGSKRWTELPEDD